MNENQKTECSTQFTAGNKPPLIFDAPCSVFLA